MADPVIIDYDPNVRLGSTVTITTIEGETMYKQDLIVDREFTQGKDAKASGYKYFMNSPKGVYGLKEV